MEKVLNALLHRWHVWSWKREVRKITEHLAKVEGIEKDGLKYRQLKLEIACDLNELYKKGETTVC